MIISESNNGYSVKSWWFPLFIGGIIILVTSWARGHVLRPGSERQHIFHKGWSLYVFYGLFDRIEYAIFLDKLIVPS